MAKFLAQELWLKIVAGILMATVVIFFLLIFVIGFGPALGLFWIGPFAAMIFTLGCWLFYNRLMTKMHFTYERPYYKYMLWGLLGLFMIFALISVNIAPTPSQTNQANQPTALNSQSSSNSVSSATSATSDSNDSSHASGTTDSSDAEASQFNPKLLASIKETAQQYLDQFPTSKQSLVGDLTNGNQGGYDTDPVNEVMKHFKVDWNEQAFKAGQIYAKATKRDHDKTESALQNDNFTKAQVNFAMKKLHLKH